MSNSAITPEIEASIENVRICQQLHNDAAKNLQRIVMDHESANERVNETYSALREAKVRMYETVIAKPWDQEIQDEIAKISPAPIRVAPSWATPSEGIGHENKSEAASE